MALHFSQSSFNEEHEFPLDLVLLRCDGSDDALIVLALYSHSQQKHNHLQGVVARLVLMHGMKSLTLAMCSQFSEAISSSDTAFSREHSQNSGTL